MLTSRALVAAQQPTAAELMDDRTGTLVRVTTIVGGRVVHEVK